MAYRFTLGFQEEYFTIDGTSALHIKIDAEEPADSRQLYTFGLTLSTAYGSRTQTLTGSMPEGSSTLLVPFVPSLDWAEDFPYNAGELKYPDACGYFNVTMTVHLTVYTDLNQYERELTGYAATLPAGVAADLLPTVGELTVEAVDGRVPADWGLWVQNLSVARIGCPNAAGSYGSVIYGYYFGDGIARLENTVDLRLTESGTITLPVTVQDSRGRRATRDLLLTVQPYTAPALTGITSRRCDADGTESGEGAYFTARCAAQGSTLDGANPLTVTCAWKAVTDSEYGPAVPLTDPSAGQLVEAALQEGASYEVKYTVADAFYTVDHYDYLSSTVYLLHFLKGGTGIAVGKAAEQPALFDVALDTALRRDLTVGGDLTVTGSLTQNGTDLGAALTAFGTQTEAAFTVDDALVEEVLENRIVRCGRFVLYRLQCYLGAQTEEGESYRIAAVPEGYFSTDLPPHITARQNARHCKGWVDNEGGAFILPNSNSLSYTELYGFGII